MQLKNVREMIAYEIPHQISVQSSVLDVNMYEMCFRMQMPICRPCRVE